MRANPDTMATIGYLGLIVAATAFVWTIRKTHPFLVRTFAFVGMVVIAMLIILAVASISHAAECQPSARAVWDAHPGSHATWNTVDGQRCWSVGYGQHRHHSRAGKQSRRQRKSGPNSGFDSRDGSQFEPWKVELFEQFDLYLTRLYLEQYQRR